MKKQIFTKKFLPVLLTFAMLVGVVPVMSFGVSAETKYDIPGEGDVAWVKSSSYAMEDGTTKDNSGTPNGAYEAIDGSAHHTIRNITFREAGYGGINPNYDPDLQLYCIEYGTPFSETPKYTAYKPSEHSYWTKLSATKREGILLSIGFGYPANSAATLGVMEGDAIAATQILVWEFETGYRTTYTGNASNSVLYDTCIKGTDAQSAYWKILSMASEYRSRPNYSFSDLEEQSEFVLFALDGAQTVMVYALPDEPVEPSIKKAAIEVNKTDPNGKKLSGAEFTVYNATTGAQITTIGPTNSNGYAITAGGTTNPSVPFGKYTVKETKAPAGYQLSTESWTVTLSANTPNGKVTIDAVNEEQTVTYTPVVYKKVNGKNPADGAFTFDLSRDGVWKGFAKNDANGKVTFSELKFSYADVGKTYTYSINERIPAASDRIEGMTYDNHTYKFSVTISLDASGKLIATGKDVSGSSTFSNSQTVTYTPVVYKKVNGKNPAEGAFIFDISRDGVWKGSAKNDANSEVRFPAFEYSYADVGLTYTYSIYERIPAASDRTEGMTYDNHTYKFSVTISLDASGKLIATGKDVSGSSTFNNSLMTTYTPEIYKYIDYVTPEDGAFSFDLIWNGQVLDTAYNVGTSVKFKPRTYQYSEVGNTYYYTIKESIPEDADDSTVYDTHEYKFSVTISLDASGKLIATGTNVSGSRSFYNFGGNTVSVTPHVKKDQLGKELVGGEYSYELVDATGEVLSTATNNASGEVWFDPIAYTIADAGGSGRSHTYTIREINNGDPNVIFDTKVIKLSVFVTPPSSSDPNGGPQIGNVTYYENTVSSGNKVDDPTFINTYPIGSFTPEIYKELEGKELVEGMFTFELREGDTVIETAKNGANGNVPFSAIDFTLSDVGTKVYTIREVVGDLPDVTYSDEVIELTVTIVNDGDATLEVTGTYKNDDQTITNVATTTVTAEKVWDDDDNRDGLRKDVELTLTGSDGSTRTGTIKVGETTYTWSDLPIMANGEVIEYTLTEAAMNGYTATIVKTDDGYGFTVTNKHEPQKTTITAEKVWDDDNNRDGLRADVELTLTGSDGSIRYGTIKVGETTYTWNDLFVYENGEKIEYTLTEAAIDGYSTTIVKTADGYGFTVTNKHEPAKTNVTAEKVWQDDDNRVNLRADVELTLTGSDGSTRYGTIKVGETTYTWSDLPVNANGEKIEYTLEEAVINGYRAAIVKNADGYSFIVTNTIITTNVSVSIIKRFENGDLKGGDFEFTLTDADGNKIETVTNDAEGNVDFSTLTLTYADLGEHTYTVREESGTLPGVSYDGKVLRVVVTVTETDDGELDVKVEYPDGNSFMNVYSATGSFRATMTKQLIGKQLVAGMFNFELTDADSNVLDTSTNDDTGLVTFNAVEYTLADVGEHRYYIHEIKGDAGGITYDETIIEILVNVSDNHDGTLKVDVSYPNGDTLVNTYTAVGSYTPHVDKVLTGTKLTEGQFTFILEGENIEPQTKTNDANGDVTFDTFHYTLADVGKTYIYTIREINDGKDGYTYDEHVLTITVSISDNGDGTLDVDATFDGSTVFENAYGASGSWVAQVQKELNGKKIEAGQFTFELVGGITGEVLETATNDEFGIVTFTAIEYDETTLGAFYYIIREVNEGKDGYTYDDHEIKVLVTVVDNADGTLTVTPTYEGELVFTNEYNAEGTADVSIYKELIGRELEDGEFSFELKNEAGEVVGTATNDADGKVNFDALLFDETMLGIHYYTISEVKGDLPGVTYTDKILSVAILIADNGDGTLSAKVSYSAGETLQNVYGAGGNGNVEIIKQFTDGDLKGGEFDFELVDKDGKVIATAKNDAKGLVSFPKMEYSLEDVGVYTYTVREVKGNLPNVIYTDKQLRVVITITDAGDGELDVKIEYPDGTTLVNVYNAPEVPTKPEVPKTGDSARLIGGIGLVTILGGAAIIFARRKKDDEE